MDDISPASLKCNACGHSWKARSSNPKSPQCSKCRSRDVERAVTAEVASTKGTAGTPSQSSDPAETVAVLGRLIRQFKALVHHLHGVDVIDDATFYSQFITFCPFCGAGQEKGLHTNVEGRLVCLSCGATV